MAYYRDLSLYRYLSSDDSPTTLNVGWLDKGHVYPQAEVHDDFVERLWRFCCKPVLSMRGLHECDFCPIADKYVVEQYDTEERKLGSAQIRVFGQNDIIYAAPDMIYHYVVRHQYCPPTEFIQAVLEGPLPDTLAYKDRAMGQDWFIEAERFWKLRERIEQRNQLPV